MRALLLLIMFCLQWPVSAFAAGAQKSLDSGVWELIVFPIVSDAYSISDLLSDDLPAGEYTQTWTLFRYDPVAGQYVTPTLAESPDIGNAYWIIQATGAPVTIDVPGLTPEETQGVVSAPCSTENPCAAFEPAGVTGGPGYWSMHGSPEVQERSVDEFIVRAGSVEGACATGCTLAEAYAAEVMWSDFFAYDGASESYQQLSAGSTVAAWDGLWVRTLSNSATTQVFVPIVPPTPTLPNLQDYVLVFGDEFDTPELDSSKWDSALLWGPYLPINEEQQMYVDALGMHSDVPFSPFEMTGDTLKINAVPITPALQPPARPEESSPLWKPNPYSEYRYNGPVVDPDTGEVTDPGYQSENVDYLSGIITSYGSFNMTHGYVEMRARVPEGQGLWPAFWMLPMHYVESVPEIDVMEFLGQDVSTLYNTYHYFDIDNNWAKVSTPSYEVIDTDWTEAFHTFGMSWSPRKISWYVDGVKTHEITDADYLIANQSMYLLANVATGGTWPGPPDASTPFPATLEIDYIRAYKQQLSETLDLQNDYQLMFNDEFSGTVLNADNWTSHFLWGPYWPINNEEQYYIDILGSDSESTYSPFTVGGGNLTITARAADDPDGVEPPAALPALNDQIWKDYPTFQIPQTYTPANYTSGLLTSYHSFKFAHGYAEIRARVPKGAGQWPAFWLLNGYYVSQQPEIDILEVRGENPHQIVHSYHRDEAGVLVSDSFTTDNGEPVDGYADGFHTYGARWEPGKITWYIDEEAVHSYENEDVGYQVMYVLLNLAIGGDFHFTETDTTVFPSEFVIDYVRVYQEKDPE